VLIWSASVPSVRVGSVIEIVPDGRAAAGIPLLDEAEQKRVDVTHR
jgi:hypothetical protein